jgi:putative copper export protein
VAGSAGVSVGDLLGSAAGTRLIRTGVVLAGLAAAVVAAVVRRSTAVTATVGALSLIAMFAHVATGHAGSPGMWMWAMLGMQCAHFAVIGAWIGGLVWLLVSRSTDPGPVGRFSTMATICLTVVVVTGTTRAIGEIGRLEALWSSDYGRLLLIKIAVVALLVALGAINRFSNVPSILRGRAHGQRLRRTVRGEVGIAVVVLALTGMLATTHPPAQSSAHDDHAEIGDEPDRHSGITVTGSDFATTVQVTLHVEPGVIGENTFTVELADYDTGQPVDAVRVALRFDIPDRPEIGPTIVELDSLGPGTWDVVATNVAQPARWRATAIVTYVADGIEVPLEFDIG